jgi:hypothetical protein
MKIIENQKKLNFQKETREIQEYWKNLVDRCTFKFFIQITSLPPLFVKKNLSKDSIRIGIQQGKESPYKGVDMLYTERKKIYDLYFDYKYCNSKFQETILMREMFPIITDIDPNSETSQTISTIWAIWARPFDNRKYLKLLKKIPVEIDLTKKALQWIEERLIPATESDPELYRDFGKFLEVSCKWINQNHLLVSNGFLDVYLLWLMKSGVDVCNRYSDDRIGKNENLWVFFELLEYYFSESDLCQKYGLNNGQNNPSLALIHLCSRAILDKSSEVEIELLTGMLPNYVQMENALRNFKFSHFIDLVPKPLFIKNEAYLNETLNSFFETQGLLVHYGKYFEMLPNTEKILEFSILNRSDWVLKKFSIQEIYPGLLFKKVDPPILQEFTGSVRMYVYLRSPEKIWRYRLVLKLTFEDPLNPGEIKNIGPLEIDIKVIQSMPPSA